MSDSSRVEQLLRNALGDDIYEVTPQSRVEELLQELNEVIEGMESSVSPEDIATAVSAYLDEHLTNPTNPPVDTSLAIAGAAADAQKTGVELAALKEGLSESVGDLKSAIDFDFEIGRNLINPSKMVVGLISGNTGAIDSSSTSYKTTDFIPITNGQSVVAGRIVRRFIAFDANKQAIAASYQKDQQTNYVYTATADGYVRATYANSYVEVDAQIEYGSSPTTYEPYCNYLTNNVRFGEKQIEQIGDVVSDEVAKEINLIDQTQYETGIIDRNNGTISVSGSGANYRTTDYIPILKGQTIVFSPRIRKFLAYKITKVAITTTYLDADTPNYSFTATENGYVRASFYMDYINVAQAEYASIPTSYIPYGDRRVYEDIKVPAENIENLTSHNNISGKKWCACGDSFTQGDFTGLQESEYKLQSGRYVGKNAVYPFIIGDRQNMDVVNLAVGGMTLCCIDGTRQNAFTYNEYYKQIPLDSDYITFKFGINDNNYSSPVGTIDDNVITTFYGAWNVVLDWVTTNFPTQKIGIIITNGITDNAGQVYLEATRNICKKWGIPYIDEVADETVPLLLRVKRTGLSDTIYNRKLETFRVSSTNLHPNVACHYYESTFIGDWLNSL